MSLTRYQMTPEQAVEARRRILPNMIRDVEAVLAAVRANPFHTVGIAVTVTTDPPHIECDLPTPALTSMLSMYLAVLQREFSGDAAVPPTLLPDMAPQVHQFEMIGQVLKDASTMAIDAAGGKLLARAGSHANVVALALKDLTVCMEEIASAGLLPR